MENEIKTDPVIPETATADLIAAKPENSETKNAGYSIPSQDNIQTKLEKLYQHRDEIKLAEERQEKKNKTPWVAGTAITVLVVVLIVGGTLFLWKKNKMAVEQTVTRAENILEPKENNVNEQAVDVPAVEESKPPVEARNEDNFKSEEIKITVLNGGATAGSAGKVQDLLVKQGYKLAQAQNAQADNHSGTAIYYSQGFDKTAGIVKNLLKAKYPKTETKPAETDEEKSADLVIMLGK